MCDKYYVSGTDEEKGVPRKFQGRRDWDASVS